MYDENGFNKDGHDIYGFDKNGLNKDGLNKYGYKKSSGKGLNISSLSKIYSNNNSKELINDIKQLVKNLYKNKQITKQVYNTLSSFEL